MQTPAELGSWQRVYPIAIGRWGSGGAVFLGSLRLGFRVPRDGF